MVSLATFATRFLGRHDDFAIQADNGLYRRVGRPVTSEVLRAHVNGQHTIGSYVINESGSCSFAVFDADMANGVDVLLGVQAALARDGIPAHLELSRRGGHLWVFFRRQAPSATVRWWLRPYCPDGIEFFPKQDETQGYGSLIRVPLGVHRLTGKRYPFVTRVKGQLVPVAPSTNAMLHWLEAVPLAEPPTFTMRDVHLSRPRPGDQQQKKSMTSILTHTNRLPSSTITEWCATQDPFTVIGQYVRLNKNGIGHCPFHEHHASGQDRHASFRVYQPTTPGGACWHCYAWGQGGSVFDFLRLYYQLEPGTLWAKIRSGAHY